MKHHYTYSNPYEDSTPKYYTPGKSARIQCDIPKKEYDKFYAMLPHRSAAVFQTTFSILTHKLLQALYDHGFKFNPDDGERFKEFIAGVELVAPTLSGTPPLGLDGKALSSDDKRGEGGTGEENTGTTDKLANSPSEPAPAKSGTGRTPRRRGKVNPEGETQGNVGSTKES